MKQLFAINEINTFFGIINACTYYLILPQFLLEPNEITMKCKCTFDMKTN